MTQETQEIEALARSWMELAAAFLREHPPGSPVPADRLQALIRARDELLQQLDSRRAEFAGRRELSARAVELEQELMRRVQEDLARRRQELDQLGDLRRALGSYGGPRDDQRNRGRLSRFVDTRS